MTRRIAAIALVSVALLAGLVALALVTVHRLEFFQVRSVEVAGIRYLDERDLVARLGIPDDADILLPLEPIAESARSRPGVREARVSRRWPGTIRLTIREAPAVAMVVREGQLVVVDDRGVPLPVDPRRLDHALPIADPDSAVAALLARLQVNDPQWYRTVDRAAVEGGEVVLHLGPRVVRLDARATSTLFRRLAAVREWLSREGIGWSQIDARFDGRMFVRKEAA
jgi:cell division septal protein FtsQ